MEVIVRDIPLAAMLHMNGFKIVRVDLDKKNMANFIFVDSEELRHDKDQYFRKDALVEPKKFSIAIKDIKQMIWEKKNGN